MGGGPGLSHGYDGESEETKAWDCLPGRETEDRNSSSSSEGSQRLSKNFWAESAGQPPRSLPWVSLVRLRGSEAPATLPVTFCPMWQRAEAHPPVHPSGKIASHELRGPSRCYCCATLATGPVLGGWRAPDIPPGHTDLDPSLPTAHKPGSGCIGSSGPPCSCDQCGHPTCAMS